MKRILLLITLMCLANFSPAQSLLDGITFESVPKRLLLPKLDGVTVRARPSATAPLYTNKEHYPRWLFKYEAQPIYEENTGWYRIGDGQWVSKKETTACQCQPINGGMLNRYFGYGGSYDDCGEWIVTSVGKKGFFLFYDGNALQLGRAFGNIIVFKYVISFRVNHLEGTNDFKTCLLDKTYSGGCLTFTLHAGDKYFTQMKHGSYTSSTINLAMFTDRVIEAIFEDAIKRNVCYYRYFCSDLLGGKWANYDLG